MKSIVVCSVLAACGAASAAPWLAIVQEKTPQPPPPKATNWRPVSVAQGLTNPWGLAWLPDGRALITQKGGTLVVATIKGDQSTRKEVPLEGLPKVYAGGQGGFMDVALHPDFRTNRYIYFTMSVGTGQRNQTVLVRGVYGQDKVTQIQQIWSGSHFKPGGQHFGSRIVFLKDKTLIMSIGDGGNPPNSIDGVLCRDMAQLLNTTQGKTIRLTGDGKPAPGNPFAGQQGKLAEIWSYGHRNIQGLAIDPKSGRVYANEHGARGGDELNEIQKGKNYGWPKATYSIHYNGDVISNSKTLPGMMDPMVVWTPCPAPSGLAFYTGDKFPAWKGDLFSGGLAGTDVRRIDLDANGKVIKLEQLDFDDRIRDVRQGPDGYLYVLTDSSQGELIRIMPK